MDADIEQIWQRTKKDIDISRLKSKSKGEAIQKLNSELESISKNREQIEILKRFNFAEKLVEKQVFQKEFLVPEVKVSIPKIRVVTPKDIFAAAFIRKTSKARVSIRIKGRFRSFKQKNLKLTSSAFRGKPAVYVSNLKGKRLTWGLIK